MVIGAGGASRAAVYALFAYLGCGTIYIVNRLEEEVAELQADARAYGADGPTLVHVKSVKQAWGVLRGELLAMLLVRCRILSRKRRVRLRGLELWSMCLRIHRWRGGGRSWICVLIQGIRGCWGVRGGGSGGRWRG